MKEFKTEQELFWAGRFGDDYVTRNSNAKLISNNLAMFSKILDGIRPVESVIEFGANIGFNLIALKSLLPNVKLSAIEINESAVTTLQSLKQLEVKIYPQSILEFVPDFQRDFVLVKGVLIHLNPSCLQEVYDLLYQTSNRYICIAEYYNPVPVEVTYRGHQGKLFKRDFTGEMLDKFSDLRLLRYGFAYHRDPLFPQDDTNWFLLEKCKS